MAATDNQPALEIATADEAVSLAASIAAMDATDLTATRIYARALARRVLAGGDPLVRNNAAASLLNIFENAREAERPDLDIIGDGGLALGVFYEDLDNEDRAAALFRSAYETLAQNQTRLSAEERFAMYRLCKKLNDADACAPIAETLRASGFRHPLFAALQENAG